MPAAILCRRFTAHGNRFERSLGLDIRFRFRNIIHSRETRSQNRRASKMRKHIALGEANNVSETQGVRVSSRMQSSEGATAIFNYSLGFHADRHLRVDTRSYPLAPLRGWFNPDNTLICWLMPAAILCRRFTAHGNRFERSLGLDIRFRFRNIIHSRETRSQNRRASKMRKHIALGEANSVSETQGFRVPSRMQSFRRSDSNFQLFTRFPR